MIRTVLLALSATTIFGECITLPEKREGTIEVLAVDLTGQQVPTTGVEYFLAGSRVAEMTTKSSKSRLPYGEYRVRVYAPGFRSAWRDVVVDQPETTVRVPVEVGSIGCPHSPTSIGGTILQDRTEGELWVKVIPVRGTGGGESRVSNSGYFLVSGLQPSAHVILVMRDETVLHTEVIRTYPLGKDTSKLTIDLRQRR